MVMVFVMLVVLYLGVSYVGVVVVDGGGVPM